MASPSSDAVKLSLVLIHHARTSGKLYALVDSSKIFKSDAGRALVRINFFVWTTFTLVCQYCFSKSMYWRRKTINWFLGKLYSRSSKWNRTWPFSLRIPETRTFRLAKVKRSRAPSYAPQPTMTGPSRNLLLALSRIRRSGFCFLFVVLWKLPGDLKGICFCFLVI